MTSFHSRLALGLAAASLLLAATSAQAHKLRLKGEAVAIAASSLTIVPTRDWNSLSRKIGKNSETWTLDGEQLNNVTFFAAVPAGSPLRKEQSKKHAPLPKFTSTTLLAEVPELLEGTYRSSNGSGLFRIVSTAPESFLGQDGVTFTYEFTDEDELTRKGEARAAIVGGKLYMISFDAPRLNYFDKGVADFRTLAASATLK